MGPAKPAFYALVISLSLHAALGWTLLNGGFAKKNAKNEIIQITYPELPKNSPAIAQADTIAKTQPAPLPETPKVKRKGIPVPRYWVKEEPAPVKEPAVSEFRKELEENLKNQEKMLAKLNEEQKQRAAAKRKKPKTSAEMLADPQKGKIFFGYQSEIKKKIQTTLTTKYAHRYKGKGSVELMFVLSPAGVLEKVVIMPRGTEADDHLQDLAVQCLRESAPFGLFPKELGSDRIVFNITVLFEEK